MKILEPVDHTAMDSIVWAEVCIRTNESAGTLYTRSLMEDQRNAKLMLQALQDRGLSVWIGARFHYWPFPARRMRWHR